MGAHDCLALGGLFRVRASHLHTGVFVQETGATRNRIVRRSSMLLGIPGVLSNQFVVVVRSKMLLGGLMITTFIYHFYYYQSNTKCAKRALY